MRFRRLVGVVAALVSVGVITRLVSCDEMPITAIAFRIENPWAIAQAVMPLPVIVVGRPYADPPPARVAEIVATTMAEAISWTRDARFVLVPAASAGQGLRIVIAFNAKGDLCRDPGPGGGPHADGRIEIQALFCDGEDRLADVSGRIGRSDGANDRRFRSLIRQVTAELLRPPPAPHP